jgi:hypothetical protein
MMRLLSSVLCVIGLAACGGGGGGGDDAGDDAPDADPGPSDPQFDDTANQVIVRESRWDSSNARGDVSAVFADGLDGVMTETMRAGNCRLLTSDAAYCPGPCSGFCVDDVCHDFPTYRDAGRITFTGLSDSVSMTFSSGYYAPDSFPVPTDLFDAGDAVTASAQGADIPAFTLAATGVATLGATLSGTCENEWHIQRGQDAVIQWSDPVVGTRVRLRLPSENAGHGLPSLGVIECEGPDTGELRVPAALIDAMPDFRDVDGCGGLACVNIDCPPSTMARYSAASTTAGGAPVVLRVESEVTFIVHDN